MTVDFAIQTAQIASFVDETRGMPSSGLLIEEEKGSGERNVVKMGFFERLHAKKEEKRLEREERRELWRAERRTWMESRAERRAEWRAGRGRRGCCRQTC